MGRPKREHEIDEYGFEIPWPRPHRGKRPGSVGHLMKIDTAPLFRQKGGEPVKITLNEIDEIVRYILALERAYDEHTTYYDQLSEQLMDARAAKATTESRSISDEKRVQELKASNQSAQIYWQGERTQLEHSIEARNSALKRLQSEYDQEHEMAAKVFEEVLPLIGDDPDWPLDTDDVKDRVRESIRALRTPKVVGKL